jgi:hypothetical protein
MKKDMLTPREVYSINNCNVFDNGIRAVCKRCGIIMNICEPTLLGEYWHPKGKDDKDFSKVSCCANAGKQLDLSSKELVPFMKKAERRRNRRDGRNV